jgi:DNA-binding NarL/FixJ family response regulator
LTIPATDTRAAPLTRPALGVLAGGMHRRRLAAVLERSPFEIVAVGATVQTLLDGALVPFELAVLAGGPDMLARGGPIELLRNLRPGCPIVLVCEADGRAIVRKALRAGVDGFVPRASVDDALEGAIAAVLAGQLSVPQSIRARVSWATFSLREKQVLQFVAAGLTNGEIADRLFLSESTVKSHLSASFRKLGVSSRAEAAAAVLDPQNGLPEARPPFSLEQQLLGGSV